MEPGTYTLHIKAIPDADSGPKNGGFVTAEMEIGRPVQLEIVGNATLQSETSGIGLYLIHNRSTWAYSSEFAYFMASNVEFGNYYGDTIRAKSRGTGWWWSSAEFQGELISLQFNLRKWYDSDYVPGKVYGLDALFNETELSCTPNGYSYDYDLSGYAGVKFEGYGDTVIERVFISYYK